MTLSADERAAIGARHRVAEGEDDHRAAGTDAFHIDCDAARLCAALVAAEEQRDAAQQAFRACEDDAMTRSAKQTAVIREVRAERDAAETKAVQWQEQWGQRNRSAVAAEAREKALAEALEIFAKPDSWAVTRDGIGVNAATIARAALAAYREAGG